MLQKTEFEYHIKRKNGGDHWSWIAYMYITLEI